VRGGFERLSKHIIEHKYKEKEKFLKYFLKYVWIFIVDFISYKIADGIILTSDLDISFIEKIYNLKKKKKKNQIKHFFNFIDIDLFKPLTSVKKDKHILFIGRITEQKNLFNLIYALKDLNEFTLDIIGEGNLENKLREKANELKVNVNFLGIFPNNEIPKIMNLYQIFILPSYWEGNPKVLLEAMSCGLACIGSNIPGITNVLKQKINGYICELAPESIKSAILELYNNPQLREEISKNARKFVLENCSIESIANKEFEFYKNIITK